MASLFAAFDRDIYERIIPHHLADLKKNPTQLLQYLESGGFTVSITSREWHSVALDEAHEMSAVIRPSKAYLQKTSLFFNYRIKAFKNIIQQLFPADLNTIIDKTPHARHCEENIQTMCTLITGIKQFITQDKNRGL